MRISEQNMTSSAEDKILIEGISEGNTKIFDYVFLHYYSGLVSYAVGKGVDNDMAEDLVQDFFVKLWIKRNTTRINGSLKHYLFTSIKNRCYDYFRHEKVKDSAKDLLTQDWATDDSDEHLSENELRTRIDNAIQKLPPKCRQIFILNRLEGLKPAEIAEAEGISIRTVEGHIGKAIKLLREELKSDMPLFVLMALLKI